MTQNFQYYCVNISCMNSLELEIATDSPNWECNQYILVCVQGEVHCCVNNQPTVIRENMLFRKTKITSIQIQSVSNNAKFIQAIPTPGFNNYLSMVMPVLTTLKTYNMVLHTLSPNQRAKFVQQVQMLQTIEKELLLVCPNSWEEYILIQKHHCLCTYIALDTIYADEDDVKKKKQYHSSLFTTFLGLIYKNCQTQRHSEFYANEMNLSVSHFSYKIKSESGQSPIFWIHKLTIEMLQKELQENVLSVKEISKKYNFPDDSALRIYFKKHSGQTISQYRQHI